MRTTTDKNTYISHFVGLLIILMAFSDIMGSKEIIFISSILSIVAFILCFPLADKNHVSESMTFILFLMAMSLMNLYFTDNGFGGSITLMGHLLLAYIYLQTNKKLITFWVLTSYIITIVFLGYNIFILNTPLNDIYVGLSRNHAGFAVVFWTIFLLFHLKITYNRFPLLPPIFALILTFFLFGRTSLIVSALLFLTVFYYKFKGNTRKHLVAIMALIGLCIFLWLKFGELLFTETNLGKGTDTPRWELWQIYWESIDFVNLLTGVDVRTLRLYDIYSGNPHNSFIKFHSRVGIGAIILILLYLISLVTYIREKRYYIFWLLLLLTTRAFFDSDILIGNFDFIFFIVTFYWIKTDLYEPRIHNYNSIVQQ